MSRRSLLLVFAFPLHPSIMEKLSSTPERSHITNQGFIFRYSVTSSSVVITTLVVPNIILLKAIDIRLWGIEHQARSFYRRTWSCKTTCARICHNRPILRLSSILRDSRYQSEGRSNVNLQSFEYNSMLGADVANRLRFGVVWEEIGIIPVGGCVGGFGYVVVAVCEDVHLCCIARGEDGRRGNRYWR